MGSVIKERKRESKFELLRIISMFMIILHHFILHNGYKVVSKINYENFILNTFISGGKLGVVLFVMVTGYYMVGRKKISFNKLFEMEKMVLFYSILCFLFFCRESDILSVVYSFFPLITKKYWFFSCYVILYILIPYINTLLDNIDREKYRKLLLIGFICIFLINFILGEFTSNLVLFIYYYLVGAYIKLYYNHTGNNVNYLIMFFISYFIMVFFSVYMRSLFYNNIVFADYIISIIDMGSIFVFFCAVYLFLFFRNINMGYNVVINYVASLGFGVYLFHDNFLLRSYLWNDLFRLDKVMSGGYLFLKGIIIALLIYFIGGIVEILRKYLFIIINKLLLSKDS